MGNYFWEEHLSVADATSGRRKPHLAGPQSGLFNASAEFTDDPRLATVRVAITDTAEAADFAVVDDVDSLDDNACAATPATQSIAISARPAAASPIIYLSHEGGPADYRVFVRSKRFTAREAAALIVGAHGQRPRLADATL